MSSVQMRQYVLVRTGQGGVASTTVGFAAVDHTRRWVVSGLALQVAGVAAPVLYLVIKAHKEGVGGHITAATIRLVWHSQAHTSLGLVLLVVGALAFAVGSVLMARPYVRRPVTLFVAVPLAAVAGMLLLGVLAVLVAGLIALGESGDLSFLDFFDPSGWSRKRKQKRPESLN